MYSQNNLVPLKLVYNTLKKYNLRLHSHINSDDNEDNLKLLNIYIKTLKVLNVHNT